MFQMQSRFAKLQSQLEHSEALRLNAEYQLAVSQQEIMRLKEIVEEKSSELQLHKSASQGKEIHGLSLVRVMQHTYVMYKNNISTSKELNQKYNKKLLSYTSVHHRSVHLI